MSDKWDDYDWEELPEEQLKAAMLLGWNKKLWNKDKESEISEEYDWEDLDDAQKAAAKSLGYTEKTWDEE